MWLWVLSTADQGPKDKEGSDHTEPTTRWREKPHRHTYIIDEIPPGEPSLVLGRLFAFGVTPDCRPSNVEKQCVIAAELRDGLNSEILPLHRKREKNDSFFSITG